MSRFALVISGLPASGKTTLGRELSRALEPPLFDKDDFLEGLYERENGWDPNVRRRLSREADELFLTAANAQNAAVLVSHWRPSSAASKSGTPTEWITANFDTVIEVQCRCRPEIATERFLARSRHAGHLDHLLDRRELAAKMREWAQWYPLGIGQLVSVAAEQSVPLDELSARILAVRDSPVSG